MKGLVKLSATILSTFLGALIALSPISASAATNGVIHKQATIEGPATQAQMVRAARATAGTDFYVGEALWVLYNKSPLRWCPSTSCGVIAYMPATTSLNPGGGWVTLVFPPTNGWCEINWRNNIGYTGCWRLGVLV